MRPIKIFLVLSFLFIVGLIKAQVPVVTNLQLQYDAASITNPPDSMFKVVCIVTVSDTSNIDHVHIIAGSSYGDNDKFDYSFPLSPPSGYPAGTSVSQDGNTFTITLGDMVYGDYYYEVKLQDNLDNWSAIMRWNTFGQQ